MPAQEINLQQLKSALEGFFVVTDSNVKRLYGSILPPDCFVLEAGEACKTLSVVEKIASEILSRGLSRGSRIAAVGGGTVGDVTGFTAAVYMRGIKWINVPTTLLAMADSSAGGKTGVNLGAGLRLVKNALGAFHSPERIYHCYEFLETLAAGETANGMAEIIKTGLLDARLYTLIDKKARVSELIGAACSVKEKITAADFFDYGARRALNMGHTVGHAIEAVYGLSHGQSVVLGLVAEQFMAGLTPPALREWTVRQATAIADLNDAACWDADLITQKAGSDKKNTDGITLVVPVSLGEVREAIFTPGEFREKLSMFIAARD